MFTYLPQSELLEKAPIEFGLAKLCGSILESVGIGVVEGQHEEEERLLCEFLVVQGDTCRKGAHSALSKRNGIELLPYLKPPGDLILIEGFQAHRHSTLGNPGAIDDSDAARDEDGQWSALVCLSLLECLHAQQKIGLHSARGLQQLIKTVEHHDRQRAVARFNKLRPWNPFPGNVADSKLDLILQVRFSGHLPQLNTD